MKNLGALTVRCLLLFVLSLSLLLLPAEGVGHAQTTDAQQTELIKLQQNWAEARKIANMAFLEKFYAAEFTVGNMDGTESSRAQDLSMFSSGDLKPTVISDDQMVVHVYGQAALVTGLEHLEGIYRGHSGSFDLRFANTFVYRDDRWQLVRHQATPTHSDKTPQR